MIDLTDKQWRMLHYIQKLGGSVSAGVMYHRGKSDTGVANSLVTKGLVSKTDPTESDGYSLTDEGKRAIGAME